MNGLNVSAGTERRSSPVQKVYSSPTYKSTSPTRHVREYSPLQQTASTYKTSSNYSVENSSSTYHVSTSYNHARSPNSSQSPVSRNLHSPSMVKETKEIYSSSTYNQSRSPTVQSPSLVKESKDIYTSTSMSRSRSPNLSPTAHGSRYSPVIKESRDIYNSGSLKRSRSPNPSPMTFRSATQSPVNRSFSPRNNDRDGSFNRRGSIENGAVDTSSNVRVSSMVGGTSRRDSWDAIEKTKSLLSYGSLESLANLTNNAPAAEGANNQNCLNNNYKNTQNYSSRNASHTQSSSTNYTSTQKLSSDYSASQKYANESNTRTQTHGILKNKNNNYYKSVDTTDGTHDRYLNNGTSGYATTQVKNSGIVTGSALETLPIHKPTSFVVDPSIDPNKVAITISGKFHSCN